MPRSRRRLLADAAAVLLATGGLVLSGSIGPAGGGSPVASADEPAPPARPVPPAGPDDERPNVVLITTDDQSLTDLEWMPRTRRLLGERGITFTNGLSPHPVCCPARAQILTGQYAQNNGVRANGTGRWGGYAALDESSTLPLWLQRAGYRTGFVGKYLNGYTAANGIEPGWDDWNPTVRGVYDYYDFSQYDNGTVVDYPESGGVYITDLVAAETADMIEGFSAEGAPFFIWSSYVAPHGVVCRTQPKPCTGGPVPAADLHDGYPDLPAADPVNPASTKPSFNEADLTDKPAFVRAKRTNPGPLARLAADPTKVTAPMRPAASYDALHSQRVRALASVDDAVAGTVAALERTGELDNTLVLFTSDNGYLLGEHRWKGKLVPYEEALRVPMLLRGPGVPTGETRDQVFAMLDIAPTVLEAAGATAGLVVDGRPMQEFITAPGAPDQRTTLIQAGPHYDVFEDVGWTYRGVRTGRYTFAKWSGDGFEELYDRRVDPYQLRNVAGRARYEPVLREMARRTRILSACSGAKCRRSLGADPEPVARAGTGS